MESIAKLLFGREAGVLTELFMPDDRAGSDMADRARRAGEWCASTPPGRRPGRTRQIRLEPVISEFPGRLTAYVRGMSCALLGMPVADW